MVDWPWIRTKQADINSTASGCSDSARYIQEDQLLHHMDQLIGGRINIPIDTTSYIDTCRDLAEKMEAFRQFTASLVEEIEVTGVQMKSAVAQMEEVSKQAAQLTEVFQSLQGATSSVKDATGNVLAEIERSQQEHRDTLNNALASAQTMTSSAMTEMSEDTNARLNYLGTVVGKVDNILEKIGYISVQTRLLSINAGIEAARAGHNGASFQVIAEEIQKLSDESTQAVKNTESITGEIKTEIKKVMHAGRQGQEKVCDAVVLATREIEDTIQAHHNNIASVLKSTQAMQTKIDAYLGKAASQMDIWAEVAKGLGDAVVLFKGIGQYLDQTAAKVKTKEDVEARDDSEWHDLQNSLQAAAFSEDIRSLDRESHKRYLLDVLAAHNELEAIYSTRADGTFIFSKPPAQLVNARIRDWWQQAAAGNDYISPAYVSAITHKTCRTLAVPICSGKAGETIGVLAADVIVR